MNRVFLEIFFKYYLLQVDEQHVDCVSLYQDDDRLVLILSVNAKMIGYRIIKMRRDK
jgi:hypothetical protein